VVLIDLTTGVRRAVAGLDTHRREAVEHVLAGHTLVQAAGRLGVPEGTLKSRVRAAYADLRAVLASSRTA
jgi:DNA-directed RNA polymerase specialized sigma24 family protein